MMVRSDPSSIRSRLSSTPARALLLAAIALTTACDLIEEAAPQPRKARIDRSRMIDLDVPRVMRGTIAAETIVRGYNPVIVRGYGLVVGLDGTGSADIPPPLRAYMRTEMSRRGIGQESSGFGHLSPDRMLDSEDTAVVIIEAIIPAGAVGREVIGRTRIPGTGFDVRVYAHPASGTTSLEGGRLYTSELRPVGQRELPPLGSRQAAALAEAGGPIFVNPFIDAADSNDAVNRTVGRIMNGGEVLKDIPIKLRLASPNHTRAEIIQNSINAAFPQEPGQKEKTAHGKSDELIIVTVPPSYRHHSDDFVELLRHSSIRRSGAEGVALSVKRAVLANAAQAYDASWRWQAIGVRALQTLKTMYDYPEDIPRLAALRAGAKLDDPQVIPHLIDMAKSASYEPRRQAVQLLGELRLDPRIDRAMRELLNDDDVDVRLAAYEAQVLRFDPNITRHRIDGKFVLDVVECDTPMIYVTQVGEPRIAIFGRDIEIERPSFVDAWAGRFLMKASADEDLIEVYFRPKNGGERIIERTSPDLEGIIQFLGHHTTVERPEPGLSMSYGDTVAALYEISRQGAVKVDFKFEQDRVRAAILQQQDDTSYESRPEFSDPDYDFLKPVGDDPDLASSDLDDLLPPTKLDGR